MSWDSKVEFGTDNLINVKKDTDKSGLEKLEDPTYRKFIDQTYQVIQKVEEIGLPKKGEQVRAVTFRNFNAAVFLKYICEANKIKKLNLVVYSINAEAAKLICELIDSGRIENCTILMSNLRNKAHRSKEQLTRDLFVNNPKVDLFFASSHGKIMTMQTEDGNYYCVEGSGNMSYNSRVEQYVIDNDKGLHEFTTKWMSEIKTFLKDKKELVLTQTPEKHPS